LNLSNEGGQQGKKNVRLAAFFPTGQSGQTQRRSVVSDHATLPRSPVFRNLKAMDVNLTPDQKAFARRAIESGRLHSEQDAVQEALALWGLYQRP
jgi:hypothetical protein